MSECVLQKELRVTCTWWIVAMMIALPETGVPSAVENWSLAFSWGSDFSWEQGCLSLIASAVLDAVLQEFCIDLEGSF